MSTKLPKTNIVRFSVDDEEKRTITDSAESEMLTVAAWCRRQIFMPIKRTDEFVIPATKKTKTPPVLDISWSPEGGLENITEQDRENWADAYPACDIDRQLAAAHEWLLSNPVKAKKKLWRKFITGWLGRSQERGGDAKSNRVDDGLTDFQRMTPREQALSIMEKP